MQPGSYRYQTFYRQLKPIQTAQWDALTECHNDQGDQLPLPLSIDTDSFPYISSTDAELNHRVDDLPSPTTS